MCRHQSEHYAVMGCRAVLWAALAGLSACQQTPAPEQGMPPNPPVAGQVVPVTPHPAPPAAAPPPAPAATSASAPAPAVDTSPKSPARKPAPSKAPPSAAARVPSAKPPPVAEAKPAAPAAPPPAPLPAAAAPKPVTPALDLASLEQRLRDTKAIGVFTKLSLKNQVDDLLGEVRQYHRDPRNPPQPVVRQHFEGLMMKVLSSLQGGDPQLASTIAASRETLWGILIDPDKFSKI